MKRRKRAEITGIHPAGTGHRVVTVEGGPRGNRRSPCEECPWRVDRTGSFPAQAFRISAHTAYDQSFHEFGCHMSGTAKPQTCAGYLLRGAEHNLATRLKRSRDEWVEPTDGGLELHPSYRAMAEANGVAHDDPSLALCRGEDEEQRR